MDDHGHLVLLRGRTPPTQRSRSHNYGQQIDVMVWLCKTWGGREGSQGRRKRRNIAHLRRVYGSGGGVMMKVV